MLNQVVLVGRLKKILREESKCIIKLSVPRNYKNNENKYDTDIITCGLKDSLVDCVIDNLKENDLIGVKGHVENCKNEEMIIIGEKVTFLSNSTKQI